MIPLDTLTLFLSWKCDLACSHCGFSCGPRRTETMERGLALSCIESAAQIPGLKMVAYSGGEPFLLYNTVVELMAHSRDRGLSGGIVTNCSWADTDRLVRARIGEMRRLGLAEIIVSADDFHLEQVPLSCVRRVVEAALAEDVRVGVNVLALKNSRIRAPDVPELLGLPKEVLDDPAKFWIQESSPLRVGRARRRVREEELITWDEREMNLHGCRFIVRNMVVTPGGEVFACCGFADASARGPASIARAGTLRRASFEEIFGDTARNLLFNLISAAGPAILLRMAEEVDPGAKGLRRYVSSCEICSDIAMIPRLRRAVAAALEGAAERSLMMKGG